MTSATLPAWSRRAPTTRSWPVSGPVTRLSSRSCWTTGHGPCCCSPGPSSPRKRPPRRSSRTPGSQSSGASTGSRADPPCAPGSTGSWSTPRRSAACARDAPCRGAASPTTTTDRPWTRLSSATPTTTTPAAGVRSRSRGRPARVPCSQGRSAPGSVPRSTRCPTGSAWSSPCVTSWDTPPGRSARCSRSRAPTSESSCTGHGRRCAANWRRTSSLDSTTGAGRVS